MDSAESSSTARVTSISIDTRFGVLSVSRGRDSHVSTPPQGQFARSTENPSHHPGRVKIVTSTSPSSDTLAHEPEATFASVSCETEPARDSAVKHRPNAALGYCSFGPFHFFLLQRVLVRAGTTLRIGSRAREILLALVERAGEVVSKRELISRVWPHTIIEEVTLRAHIAALRKVLGDAEAGMPYVQNVTGLGYRFAAPVVHTEDALAAAVNCMALVSSRHAKNHPRRD